MSEEGRTVKMDGYTFAGMVSAVEKLYDYDTDEALDRRDRLVYEVAVSYAPSWIVEHLERLNALDDED